MELEDAPTSWRIVKLNFLRKPDAAPRKGIRSYRAIALTSVMSKWYAACVVLRLEKEWCPKAGNSCMWEGLVASVVNTVKQKHWE